MRLKEDFLLCSLFLLLKASLCLPLFQHRLISWRKCLIFGVDWLHGRGKRWLREGVIQVVLHLLWKWLRWLTQVHELFGRKERLWKVDLLDYTDRHNGESVKKMLSLLLSYYSHLCCLKGRIFSTSRENRHVTHASLKASYHSKNFCLPPLPPSLPFHASQLSLKE